MNTEESEFAFALCNKGSERALKLEVQASGLAWRPSYQRRGFVTFKLGEGFQWDDLSANLACARRLCLSLGKFASEQEARACLGGLDLVAVQHLKHEDHRIRPQASDSVVIRFGDRVGTLVELSEGEFWAGVHEHRAWLSPWAGGDSALEMPEHSPSRAWLKLEEAVRFFDLKFSSADIAVELGCAPGGVVLALLERGVPVIGVDPAKMADRVMQDAVAARDQAPSDRVWFYHCRKPAALVGKRDLGRGVSWFMSDMNQAPEVVLRECARFVKMAPSIRGVLITLKLTQLEQVAAKPQWLEALREMGFKTTRLQQLAVHHKEFALLGLK